MWASPALWAPLVLALWAGKWDSRLQLSTELRAGEGPRVVGEAPRAGVAVVALPTVLLRWMEQDLRFQIDYGARVFWRQPNELGHQRPLLLHNAHLTLFDQLASHLELRGQSLASLGEADYSILPTLFASPQSSLPAVAKIFAVSSGLRLAWEPSALWLIEVGAEAEHRRTLGTPVETTDASGNVVPGLPLPRQTIVRETTAAGLRPTRRDLVGFSVTGAYAQYDSYPALGVSLASIGPRGYWRHLFSRQTEARGELGAALSRRWGGDTGVAGVGATDSGWTLSPTFNLTVDSHVARIDGQTWDVGGGLAAESLLDPVLAVVTNRGLAQLHVWWRAPPQWQAGLEASFVTSLARAPLPGNPDETAFSLALPVRDRVSPHWTWEWGVRWSDRAPHWDAPEFRFHQRQIWLYCSILAESGNLFE